MYNKYCLETFHMAFHILLSHPPYYAHLLASPQDRLWGGEGLRFYAMPIGTIVTPSRWYGKLYMAEPMGCRNYGIQYMPLDSWFRRSSL